MSAQHQQSSFITSSEIERSVVEATQRSHYYYSITYRQYSPRRMTKSLFPCILVHHRKNRSEGEVTLPIVCYFYPRFYKFCVPPWISIIQNTVKALHLAIKVCFRDPLNCFDNDSVFCPSFSVRCTPTSEPKVSLTEWQLSHA